MRCGCPHCEAFMIQSEGNHQVCVCPECGYRCNACLGTGTVISREDLSRLREKDWFAPDFNSSLNDEEAEEREGRQEPVTFSHKPPEYPFTRYGAEAYNKPFRR